MTKEERLKAARDAYPMLKGLSNSNKITVVNQRAAFIKGAEAEAESKWIACNDLMPERGVCVLVYIDNGAITCAHTSIVEDSKTWQLYGDMQSVFDVKYQQVTHWQPLPTPPLNQQ